MYPIITVIFFVFFPRFTRDTPGSLIYTRSLRRIRLRGERGGLYRKHKLQRVRVPVDEQGWGGLEGVVTPAFAKVYQSERKFDRDSQPIRDPISDRAVNRSLSPLSHG